MNYNEWWGEDIEPMQAAGFDSDGWVRFLSNRIVQALVSHCEEYGHRLVSMTGDGHSPRDWRQMYQLLGDDLSTYLRRHEVREDARALARANELAQAVREAGKGVLVGYPCPRQPIRRIDGEDQYEPNTIVLSMVEFLEDQIDELDLSNPNYTMDERVQFQQLTGQGAPFLLESYLERRSYVF